MVSGSLGERIAAYRRRRGLSQAALAGLVGRSESWLSQVERGIRSVDRLSVLLDIAKILHVDVQSLIGRPWQLAPNGPAVAQGLDAVRQVMTRYDHLLGADRAATVAVEADSMGARGMAAYQVVCALLRADHTEEAERLAVGMAEKIHGSATAQTPTLVSVAGALWLIAAVAAARRTDRG